LKPAVRMVEGAMSSGMVLFLSYLLFMFERYLLLGPLLDFPAF
jgi:hypothetical protein